MARRARSSTERAATLARYARSLPGHTPRDRPCDGRCRARRRSSELVTAIDPDVVQLSGHETVHDLTYVKRPTWKVVRAGTDAEAALDEARRWIAAGCERIVVDASHGNMLGGTGQLRPIAPPPR